MKSRSGVEFVPISFMPWTEVLIKSEEAAHREVSDPVSVYSRIFTESCSLTKLGSGGFILFVSDSCILWE